MSLSADASPEEILDSLLKFIDADSPEQARRLCEEEQHLLLHPQADSIFVYIIDESVRKEETKEGVPYLQMIRALLQRAREVGIAEAWEYLAHMEQQEMERFERIEQALDALARTNTWEDAQAVLEREQELLLTEDAEKLAAYYLQEAEQSTGTDRDRHLHVVQQTHSIIQRAREVGIAQAIADITLYAHQELPDEQKALFVLLDRWLRTPTSRQKRHFLEEHLRELMMSECEPRLQQLMASQPSFSGDQTIVRFHLEALRQTRERGGTVQAAREAYVNIGGGFALDLPDWLEHVEQQLERLPEDAEAEQTRAQRTKLLREAITFAERDTTLAPELLAELRFRLGLVLAQYPEGSQVDALTGALASYHSALQTFTRERYPRQFARIERNLGILYTKYEEHLVQYSEQAISCYEIALQILTFDSSPIEYVHLQKRLGDAYTKRIAGDARTNQEKALASYQATLQVWARENFPAEWGDMQNALGFTCRSLSNLSGGERSALQEQALSHHQAAFQVFTRRQYPEGWAITRAALGDIYAERLQGSRAENQEKSIRCYQDALEIFTSETHGTTWALVYTLLGQVYAKRLTGERGANIEKAIACFESASQVYTRESFPIEWGQVQNNLAGAYMERVGGIRWQNYEQALEHLQATLMVLTPENSLEAWIQTQISCTKLYSERMIGERQSNLRQALEAGLSVINACQKETNPFPWAIAQSNLIMIYLLLMSGDRGENQEKARACGDAALQVFTRAAFPQEWARVMLNLGNLYRERLAGERLANLQQARQYLESALEVLSQWQFPLEWGMVRLNLGATMSEIGLIISTRKEIYEQALAHCRQALQVFTEQAFPYHWAIAQQALSGIYVMRMEEDKLANLAQAITCARAALQVLKREIHPVEWAAAHLSLGAACYELATKSRFDAAHGDRSGILEEAIIHLENALQVYSADYPALRSRAQRYLGMTYLERPGGERRANLTRARECFEDAEQVFPRRTAPLDWASAHMLLGCVFLVTQEERKENIERAITCFEVVLEICQPDVAPTLWATTQANLCHAYLERLEGNQQHNLEQAILHGQAVFRVYSYEQAPFDWAEAQSNLGAAYLKRISAENRTNIEQAITHLEEASRVYSSETPSARWLLIQINLTNAYLQRVEGRREDNLAQAIRCAKQALSANICTPASTPREWGVLQMNLGTAYSLLSNHAEDGNIEQALNHYTQALRVITREAFPFDFSMLQFLMGSAYHVLASYRDPDSNRERALACYQTALAIISRDAAPVNWALLQYSIGVAYAASSMDAGQAVNSIELARTHLRQALSVFTLLAFPQFCKTVQQVLLLAEMKLQNWPGVVEAAEGIYAAEQRLLAVSTGVSGQEAILQNNVGAALFGAFALIRQQKLPEAMLLLERGRAQSLAQAIMLHITDPERIQDTQRRQRYIAARQSLQQAQNALAQMASPTTPAEFDRQTFLVRTKACAAAQSDFDSVVAEIRQATDPADFLAVTISSDTIQQAAAIGGREHALIYLGALPGVGGFALAALNTPGAGNQPSYAVLDLPNLTYELVLHLVSRGSDNDVYNAGGLAIAQDLDLQRLQSNLATARYPDNETWRSITTEAEREFAVLDEASTFMLALPELLHDANLTFLDKEHQELSSEEFALLSHVWSLHFLRLELRYCQKMLVPALLHPLRKWLSELGVTSATLIPCGYLVGLPLTALLLDDTETLSDVLTVSIAPSAQSLLHPQQSVKQRAGLYALGNPQNNLKWGEAESLTLHKLARAARLESQVSIGKRASKEKLVEALRNALIVDISCHGKVNADNFLQSNLSLASGQYLSLADILNMEDEVKGLRLAILSACQTAITNIRGAVDEVRSLAVGLIQAGARAVLASLWPVDDRATYLLMTRFAQEWLPHMDAEPPAAALARAQRWLRTVTNRELQQWETAPFPQEWKEAVDSAEAELPPSGDMASSKQTREPLPSGFRYDTSDALMIIHKIASSREPDERPFAEPMYWAGFQITGW